MLHFSLLLALVLSYNAEWFQNTSNLTDFIEFCWVSIAWQSAQELLKCSLKPVP